jgi:hypothetical protein
MNQYKLNNKNKVMNSYCIFYISYLFAIKEKR